MEQSQLVVNLNESIETLSKSLTGFRAALKDCQEAGMSMNDIRDAIAEGLPEDERPTFMAQWPMLSMMLSAI